MCVIRREVTACILPAYGTGSPTVGPGPWPPPPPRFWMGARVPCSVHMYSTVAWTGASARGYVPLHHLPVPLRNTLLSYGNPHENIRQPLYTLTCSSHSLSCMEGLTLHYPAPTRSVTHKETGPTGPNTHPHLQLPQLVVHGGLYGVLPVAVEGGVGGVRLEPHEGGRPAAVVKRLPAGAAGKGGDRGEITVKLLRGRGVGKI